MTTAEVVETSVTVNNNSPIQDYVTRTIILILVIGFFLIYFTNTRVINRGLRYIEICFVEVPMHKDVNIQIPSLH